MGLLPAVVPDIPEARSEVVPARLARKVAPLFGVPWEASPFGDRTWVCEYRRLTLSEIARGAPLPTRAQAVGLAAVTEPWEVVDRFIVTRTQATLPNELANATLNRFGPDTKAAVVLTAANRLLAPVTAAIEAALPFLVDDTGAELPVELRLAAWAGLIFEAFRSQPALVKAAVHARAVQRQLLETWVVPLAAPLADLPLARCEIGFPEGDIKPGSAAHPRGLDLVDHTLARLALPVPSALSTEADGAARESFNDELVERLLRGLVATGRLDSPNYLWRSERKPGQLTVEALMTPTHLLARYVRDVMQSFGGDGLRYSRSAPALPRIPGPSLLAGLPVPARRATIIALLTVLRQVRFDAEGRERTRTEIIPLLEDLVSLAQHSLDQEDPLAALTQCRVADIKVQTLRYDRRNDLRVPFTDLLAGVDRCVALLRCGTLDRGAAAEAISSANVEINVVRRANAQEPSAGLPSPAELERRLHCNWAVFHEALEIDLDGIVPDPAAATLLVGYHLHNYAAFLSTLTDRDQLLRAATLFRDLIIPAREQFYLHSRTFAPLRQSLQVGSRATTELGRLVLDAEGLDKAREWAGLGYRWISMAFRHEHTRQLLEHAMEPAQVTESAGNFAMLAARALLFAVEVGVPEADASDLGTVEQLVVVAEAWRERSTHGEADQFVREDQITALRRSLNALHSSCR